MSKVLVTFCKDWADEFDVKGMAIMSKDEFAKLNKWAEDACWYFGTNEGFDGENITDGFTTVDITDEEEATLKRLIPELQYSYGHFPEGDYDNEDSDEE